MDATVVRAESRAGRSHGRATALKTDVMILSWHTPHDRFFSCLVVDTVAPAPWQERGWAACLPTQTGPVGVSSLKVTASLRYYLPPESGRAGFD